MFRDQLVIGYFHAVRCSVANDSETQVCFRGGSVTASQGKDRYALAYYMQQAWLGLCTDIWGSTLLSATIQGGGIEILWIVSTCSLEFYQGG